MNIKHIILCIEFTFLAVQIIMARAANLRRSTEKLLKS